ncbi:MAG: class I SAM-dependent methyltransferase [Methanomicrobiaceae archaeon]|nr:class I SAM-dependent methyltransferase [Methanomicrobiaceae archaeon]MDD5418840.1 class I SAM-dependent methyltransferase [Methanomicrobiaceae archaeon]
MTEREFGRSQAAAARAWDEEYSSRGCLWGRHTRDLPCLFENAAVLELGCGNGSTVSAMMGQRWMITALDFSGNAVARSCRIPGAASRIHFLVADACSLPFLDCSFDAIFASHVIGHMLRPGRSRIALESARTLRKGGRLFFCGFGVDDMRFGRGKEVEEHTFLRRGSVLNHYFTGDEVRQLFGMLTPVSVRTHRWCMMIRGTEMQRSVIEATFMKEPA